ncbi:hypothetical protein P4T04_03155 [Bacillus badius]|uniref:hypothetical protein n=1 Tax=Bacillus badius TaxID=1455 RepID=UPI002E209C94|nr:hypothetical protein [Bacillus badius]
MVQSDGYRRQIIVVRGCFTLKGQWESFSFTKNMKTEIKKQFPEWCSNMEQGTHATILQGDLDSLLGCAIEKLVKGNEINYFYDFSKLYVADRTNKRKAIGIDLALHRGKSYCNHVVSIRKDDYVNPLTANLNVINKIHSNNYFDKYAGSTALMMWSYYGLPLPESEEGKMLLLCIDSGFKGHYNPDYRKAHSKHLIDMGFGELIDLLNSKIEFDFELLQGKFKTKANIVLTDKGYLKTQLPLDELSGVFGLPLELPDKQFTLRNTFTSLKGDTWATPSKDKLENLISFALTGKRKFKYTTYA